MIKNFPFLSYDTGSGYIEDQIIMGGIDEQTKVYEFDLSGIHEINKIRVHLSKVFAVVKIKNISITIGHHRSYKIDYYRDNAVHRNGRNLYFFKKNPYIEFYLFNQSVRKISLNISYVAMGEEAINDTLSNILKKFDEAIVDEKRRFKEAERNRINLFILQDIKTSQALNQINELKEKIDVLKRNEIGIFKIESRLKRMYRWTFIDKRPLKKKLTTLPVILSKQYKFIKKSGLFDAAYYLQQYADVRSMNVDPLEHYMTEGFKERNDPNPLFDSSYYEEKNPEIKLSGSNPLWHFLKSDAGEGRNPCPLFNVNYYLAQNSDVLEMGLNPLCHYISCGFKEGRNPNPFFDSKYYLKEYPDVAQSGMDPLSHFVRSGFREHRNPCQLFNTTYYLNKYKDEVGNDNPLAHFLEQGHQRGYYPSRYFERFTQFPKISVITPVYNTDIKFLHSCIRSVQNQQYFNWELCLVDDGSNDRAIEPILKSYEEEDSRIKVKLLPDNQGIAEASNEGVQLATGDYIGFLDHDDELTEEALLKVAEAINDNQPDIVYTDEEIINEKGLPISSLYKPDFSPDLLLSNNYITHFFVIKNSLFKQIGGFSKRYDGAQDYDLILKSTEKANKIFHIHKALYHWRGSETSTSSNPEIKSYADTAGKLAIESALQRRNIDGEVLSVDQLFHYHVKRKLRHRPLVSIIIPFKDQGKLLKQCVYSIFEKTGYGNFEIILVDNGSEKETTHDIVNELKNEYSKIKYYLYPIPFNYSKLNNMSVSMANGEHLVLMNNDIEILNSDWIESLLEHSQRETVGAVGGKLFYPDGSIQHAGIIIGIGGFAGHSHRFFKGDDPGYYHRLMSVQNISAVTGALMMVKTKLYHELGGMVEEEFAVALNDVDFCLRLRRRGYLNIFTPYCQAIHHESATRGYEETSAKKKRFSIEIREFKNKWKAEIERGDPYYNRNLTLNREDFSIKRGLYNY